MNGVIAALLALAATQAPPQTATQAPAADPHRPAPSFDTVPPTLPREIANGVLVFSKTNGWRHVEHLPHSNMVIADLARAGRNPVYTTENAAIFNPAQLRRFRVVVLNSVSGDVFTPDQRRAFADWLRAGGGVVALHGSGGDPRYDWPFYVREVIGAQFIGHPGGADQFQTATIRVERPDHPVMAGVRDPWPARDEWYSFASPARAPGTTVLATLDEGSYRPGARLAMGADHPLVWTRQVGRGRVVYSAIGHLPESYDDPDYRRLIANALRWVRR